MPQIGRGMRFSLALLLLAGCGRSPHQDAELAAQPVHQLTAALAVNPAWKPGKCLCVGHYRAEAVEDFPPGLLAGDFAKYRFLHAWSECEAYYGRLKKPKGCTGMTDFICSVAEKSDLPAGTARVICHVNGESEALQKAGYLQDEYDVREADGGFTVTPVSLAGSGKIHD